MQASKQEFFFGSAQPQLAFFIILYYFGLVFHWYSDTDTDTLMKIHTDTDTNTDTLNPYRYQYFLLVSVSGISINIGIGGTLLLVTVLCHPQKLERLLAINCESIRDKHCLI